MHCSTKDGGEGIGRVSEGKVDSRNLVFFSGKNFYSKQIPELESL